MILAVAMTVVVFGFVCVLVGLLRHTGNRSDTAIRFAVRGVVWMMVGAMLAVFEGLRWLLIYIFGGAA